jgi:16S rRNA processing protein RimM
MAAQTPSGPNSPESGPKYLLLGQVLRPHGVRGELRMRILTDYPERIADLGQVYIGTDVNADDPVAYRVLHMRMHQGYGLLLLDGIHNRDQAEFFRDLYAMVAIDNAVPLEDGEFYLYQLMGVVVRTAAGEELGPIIDIIETGANDVYVLESQRYGEVLFPVTDQTIVETNVPAGYIIVNLPEGLLPDA